MSDHNMKDYSFKLFMREIYGYTTKK